MLSLRRQVRELEENEIFEQMLLRGSQAGLVQPPSTDDINKLMRGMMGPDAQTISSITRKVQGVAEPAVAPGPWSKRDTVIPPDEESEADAETVFTTLGGAAAGTKL